MNRSLSDITSVDLAPLGRIIESHAPVSSNSLIPILQQIQDAYGYLPKIVLMEMGKRTGIAASQIYGVATFYEQFCFEPRGRHTIKCCRGTACHVKGGPEISEEIERAIGVEAGGTTEDMRFTFETVACLGTCFLAPVIMVDNDYYGHLTASRIEEILERYT
ncbi:MAG: NADH-quinone oxidoreductase subunit NuoE [Planctomycetota bacterium]|nr:MAG: NADH-quinone oxidoreductase subunit NuoE [Planctomycetota bacterium]